MKLTARVVPYSGIVGGGVSLTTSNGQAVFQVALMGTTKGLSRNQSYAIAHRLTELINEHGLEAPDK